MITKHNPKMLASIPKSPPLSQIGALLNAGLNKLGALSPLTPKPSTVPA